MSRSSISCRNSSPFGSASRLLDCFFRFVRLSLLPRGHDLHRSCSMKNRRRQARDLPSHRIASADELLPVTVSLRSTMAFLPTGRLLAAGGRGRSCSTRCRGPVHHRQVRVWARARIRVRARTRVSHSCLVVSFRRMFFINLMCFFPCTLDFPLIDFACFDEVICRFSCFHTQVPYSTRD